MSVTVSNSTNVKPIHKSKDKYIELKDIDKDKDKSNFKEMNIKDKRNRRRSISVFTLHSNNSIDQPKRRSFSNNRLSFSSTFYNNSDNININSNRISSNVIDRSKSTKPKSNTRFFSSPQFSSSTPNLIPNISKNIDSELKLSYRSIPINNINLIIPTIVYKCCDYIKSNPPVEGLFRMNGSIKQVNLIENELSKDINNYQFSNDSLTTVHDVAVILKRWISKLDDGLITANVCKDLTQIQKDLLLSDYPSELDDDLNDLNKFNNIDDNIENSLIDMNKSIDLTINSSNKENINLLSINKSNNKNNNNNYKTCYSKSLTKLPIENLHLVLYLIYFLNYLSKPEISQITKMHSLNLSKVFQLNFFKSVDLTIGTKSFSTEDLKYSYLINEELLTCLIDESNLIIEDLIPYINENQNQMNYLLNNKSKNLDSKELYIKKRNISSSKLPNNYKFYSSSNISIDDISNSGSKIKIMNNINYNNILDPCDEKNVSLSSSASSIINTPIDGIQDVDDDDDVIIKSAKDTKYERSDIQLSNIHTNININENSNPNVNINVNDAIESNEKSHNRRKSMFGFLNKKKTLDLQLDDSHENNNNKITNTTTSKDSINRLDDIKHGNSTIKQNLTTSEKKIENSDESKLRKSSGVKKQLKQQNASNEDTQIKVNGTFDSTEKEKSKNSKSSQDKHSQKRFSLFKFRRSS